MTDAHALAEGLTEEAARALRVAAAAMGGGVVVFAVVVASLHVKAQARVPDAGATALVNMLTTAAMAWTLAGIALGEFLWRRLVRAADNPAHANAAVSKGFILRLAVREGTALLGLTVCLLAALDGVLRAYPAYWVNAAPAVLFLFFLYARWPTLANLRSQVVDMLPFV